MAGVVAVAGGNVRGRRESDVWSFQGVPYAAAPIGARRWQAPEPPDPWAGVRDATTPGPIAPQRAIGTQIPGDPDLQSEDCLHLSVWTPDPVRGHRPVMVWLHGGGFTSGTAGSLLYRGDELARRGDVVVVAVNYRLGALGFLAHPSLDPGGDGIFANWALLDQIAALRWVRDHIASFGGDPANVTVFGESAGGMAVSALLAAPSARGLFRRAIVQSGPPYTHDVQRAGQAAEALAGELGIETITREVLVSVPAADLVRAVSALQARRAPPGELPLPLLPTVDGTVLPAEPGRAVAEGAAAGVALMIGTNRDEVTFFSLGDDRALEMDDPALERRVRHMAPHAPADEVIAAYRSTRAGRGEPSTPRDVWVAAASDVVFRWPSLRLASAQRPHGPVHVYLFTWETPVLGGALGACHALEIPFVFGTVREPAIAAFSGGGPRAEGLSVAVQSAWAAFARTGDPSNDQTGLWPHWDGGDRSTMVFGAFGPVAGIGDVDGEVYARVEQDPRGEELAVLDRYAPPAPSS